MRLFILLVTLSAFSITACGQKLLFHKNRYKEELYLTGDVISFRLKGNPAKVTRKIIGFEKDSIVFADYKISPSEISSIYVDNKTKAWFIFRYKYKKVLPILGIGYMTLDWLNTGKLRNETLLVGASLTAAGVLAKLLISDRIKIKGRRKLVILH